MPAPKKSPNTPEPKSVSETPTGSEHLSGSDAEKPEQARAAVGSYRVLSPLDHDQQRYEIGATVMLTEDQASRIPADVIAPE